MDYQDSLTLKKYFVPHCELHLPRCLGPAIKIDLEGPLYSYMQLLPAPVHQFLAAGFHILLNGSVAMASIKYMENKVYGNWWRAFRGPHSPDG